MIWRRQAPRAGHLRLYCLSKKKPHRLRYLYLHRRWVPLFAQPGVRELIGELLDKTGVELLSVELVIERRSALPVGGEHSAANSNSASDLTRRSAGEPDSGRTGSGSDSDPAKGDPSDRGG